MNQSYTELRKFVSFSPASGHQIFNQPVPTEEEVTVKAIDNPVCSRIMEGLFHVDVIPILGNARVQHVVEKNKDCLNKMISDMESFYRQDMSVEQPAPNQSVSV